MPTQKLTNTFKFRIDDELLAALHKFADDEQSHAAVEVRRAIKNAIAARLQTHDTENLA